MITPQAGYKIDPNNPNGVVKIDTPVVTAPVTTLAQDQARVANQGKPGYDVFGNPVSTTNSGPTAGSIYSGLGVDPSLTEAYKTQINNAKDAADSTVDEDQIRADTLKSFQAEIDAQNAIFADKLAAAKVTGANRLGSGSAIQARRGLLGSDFGAAQTDTINTANDQVYSSIENEKAASIAAIMSKARADATKSIEEKTKAKQEGLDSYVKYLSEGATRKQTNAQTAAQLLINAGHKVEDLTPNDLQVLTSSYGISVNDLKSAYTPLEIAAAKAKKEQDAKDLKAADEHNTSVSTIEKNKAETELNAKKFAQDTKEFGLTYALDQYKASIQKQEADTNRAKVEQTNPTSPANVAKSEGDATSTINLINTLLKSDSIDAITGFVQGKFGLSNLDPRSGTALAKNQYDQIKGLLSLENRSKLKGQGAVSDFEGATLDRAASSLSTGLNSGDFKTQLVQVKGAIATSHGLSAKVKITDPTTGESQVLDSNSAGISSAVKDGMLVEYVQ